MARQISYQTEFGMACPQAYARVSRFNSDGRTLRFNVDIYAHETARRTDKRPIESQQFEMPMPAGAFEPVKACYDHLKLQPAYATGTDV